jgi:hypothetical protein
LAGLALFWNGVTAKQSPLRRLKQKQKPKKRKKENRLKADK